MKALSFLGKGDYKRVTYVWNEEKFFTTRLFPQAVFEIFAPEKVVVFVTPGARSCDNFRDLQSILGEKMQPVDIPEGKSEEELWEIFARCDEVVEEGDEILLDITHALRSIPLFISVVAAYLRQAKNVTVRHIVYGAYEARVPGGEGDAVGRAPILDIAPFLELLDWLSGAEFFKKRGDASLLAEKIRGVHQEAWREKPGTDLPRKLKSLADELWNFSWAISLIHPREVMRRAQKLEGLLQAAEEEAARWAKPFRVLLEKVREEIAQFVHVTPETLNRENLKKQLTLATYLLEKDLVLQAVLLSREWVISYVLLEQGESDWLKLKVRERVENDLGKVKAKLEGKEAQVPEWLAALPKFEAIAEIWNALTNLRNDLAHCGMNEKAAEAKSFASRARGILEQLWGLLDDVPSWSLRGDAVTIDLRSLYGDVAKLDALPQYLEKIQDFAVEGKEVVLTGQAPVWLYLAVAHALHGKARRLLYTSPVTGEVLIFDHSAR